MHCGMARCSLEICMCGCQGCEEAVERDQGPDYDAPSPEEQRDKEITEWIRWKQ